MPNYLLSPEALDDLQNIWDYIAADNVEAADRVIEELFEAFVHLAQWPASGHTRRDVTKQGVRFWPVRSYLVVYRFETAPLQIVTILHGARDIPSIVSRM